MKSAVVTGAKVEFQVQKSDMLNELSLIQNVVERKPSIPILMNVLIRVDSDGLHVAGTDLDIALSSVCPCETRNPGTITLPAKRLFEIVRNLPDAPITFKQGDNVWVNVTCGKSRFRLAGLPSEDFPTLARPTSESAKIPTSVLSKLLTRTIFAISIQDSKYTLSGALLELKPDGILAVATDGHRLSMVKAEGVGGETRVIVSKKAMSELVKLIDDKKDGEFVEFSHSDNHLFFKIGNRLLTARMVTGMFPNYEAVIPKANGNLATVDRQGLMDAIRRVAILADERSLTIKCDFTIRGLHISAAGSDTGESSEDVEIDYSGDPLPIGFNYKYLLEFLSATDVDEVRIELKDTESAAAFKAGDDFVYVVMPMRI
jgi:DNA polymerase-3 subunit beta